MIEIFPNLIEFELDLSNLKIENSAVIMLFESLKIKRDLNKLKIDLTNNKFITYEIIKHFGDMI